jgi:DNA-binding CsgD family transcriptional regulator
MPQLSSSDCEKLLALAGELYCTEDASNLPQSILGSLRTIIPHEFGGCHLIEPSKRFIAACYAPERTPLPAEHKDFWRLAETHPLNRVLFGQPPRAWKLSDVITRQAFHLTEFYNALYRPLQVDCELVAVLPDPQAPGAFLLLSLHRQRADFSERDRTVLNLLLPHIAGARRRIQGRNGRGAAQRAGWPAEEGAFFNWLRAHTAWELTPREGEVLFWLCQGKTNGEIGRILGIAERTAETHALHIYPKMGVENRYTAIATLSRLATVENR